jgi:uroporphyrin-III C-methyltransferase
VTDPAALSLPLSLPEFAPGSVWLVGAGPGDPGLLSLLALHALRHADVVVHDALVDPRILALARGEAALEFAGKRGGKPSPKQRDISARLVELARQGKRVLRLKGGDPFVFGRGAEEALALVAAGVPFRIVPGITAGIGGLSYAGIPTTHRETNAAVTFLTGHGSAGDVPDGLDWAALARGAPVLVIYMALKHLGAIAERLIAGGRPPAEPLAIVSKAATPEQRVLETTLGAAARAAEDAAIEPPAIIVLGEVVRLRAGLDWLGALAGRTLLADPLGELSSPTAPASAGRARRSSAGRAARRP